MTARSSVTTSGMSGTFQRRECLTGRESLKVTTAFVCTECGRKWARMVEELPVFVFWKILWAECEEPQLM